jgi:hypothetical protein
MRGTRKPLAAVTRDATLAAAKPPQRLRPAAECALHPVVPASGDVRTKENAMQSLTGSLVSPASRSDGLLARALRILTGRSERAERRPAAGPWASVRPIDFEGEDTSLTQDHLAALK